MVHFEREPRTREGFVYIWSTTQVGKVRRRSVTYYTRKGLRLRE